jgi:hypothetical protein
MSAPPPDAIRAAVTARAATVDAYGRPIEVGGHQDSGVRSAALANILDMQPQQSSAAPADPFNRPPLLHASQGAYVDQNMALHGAPAARPPTVPPTTAPTQIDPTAVRATVTVPAAPASGWAAAFHDVAARGLGSLMKLGVHALPVDTGRGVFAPTLESAAAEVVSRIPSQGADPLSKY